MPLKAADVPGLGPRRRGRPAKASTLRSDQILPAALASFAQYGFGGANLRQIAAAADIDVALILYRFGSKLGLWRAVVDHLAEVFLRELSGRTAEAASATLQQTLEQLVNLVCDQPTWAMFLVKEAGEQDDRFAYFYERLIRPVHDLLLPLIEAAQAEGQAADMDKDFFFFIFTGALAIAAVMRPFIARFSGAASDDAAFRHEVKRVIFRLSNFAEDVVA